MMEAFDLAEKYRHPVLIASDAAIGQMIEAVEIPEFKEHDIDKYDWTIKGCKKGCEQRKIQNVYYTHPDYENYLREKYQQMENEEQRMKMYTSGRCRDCFSCLRYQFQSMQRSSSDCQKQRNCHGTYSPNYFMAIPCTSF